MKRDLQRLAQGHCDLLIIGGGINGACAAWDATLRGLSVAVVDKGDFGAATSANSLKVIHGGLRYLQKADFNRMREAIREQYTLMRIANHLVYPIPFLIPTYGRFKRGKEAFRLALKIYERFGWNDNAVKTAGVAIPPGRVITADECLKIFPGFDNSGLTGGAIWYDCLMYNSERLTLSFLLSAAESGAKLANYVEVNGFITEGQRICGVQAVDLLKGRQLELRAGMVLNAAGPWAFDLIRLAKGDNQSQSRKPDLALALNLVTHGLTNDLAIGIQCKTSRDKDPFYRGNRFLFLVPWRGYTLLGTSYKIFNGRTGDCLVGENDLQEMIAAFNKACPTLELCLKDVCFYHRGLLPLKNWEKPTRTISLATNHRIIDHKREDGVQGLISIIGVKYTTARALAEKAIDLVFERLGNIPPLCRTPQVPIYGGETMNNYGRDNSYPEWISEDTVQHLARNYGSQASKVVTYSRLNPEWGKPVAKGSPVLRCEILHAVRAEMAVKLTDVVLRRTELGTAGCPPKSCLKDVAQIMAQELGWDERRLSNEIEEVLTMYEPLKVLENCQ